MDKKYNGLFTFNIKQSYLSFTKRTKPHNNSCGVNVAQFTLSVD